MPSSDKDKVVVQEWRVKLKRTSHEMTLAYYVLAISTLSWNKGDCERTVI